jgi:hypothetical protein
MQCNTRTVIASLLAIAAFQLSAAYPQPAGPQTILATPSPDSYANNNFDRNDEVKITGEIAKAETLEAGLILWVVAKTAVKQGYGVRPGTEARGKGMLWRVEGSALAKFKDPAKLVVGADVTVSGRNWSVKTCDPSCRVSAEKISVK